ncbi:amino acid ABC transporter ATP-binding protein [Shinella sp. S4-D37]|uniref:amino acid ABC transporter ATP-binding protein n=1 Tax=Shinella sp. S4-D37 TaxID=3161999 RepID=UPI0034666CD4
MATIVQAKDLWKRYGALDVLRGVDLSVSPADIVTLIGHSGSGKSTLLRCINRLERIQSGSLTVCEQELHSETVDMKQLRRDVGIVFQSYNLFPHLTVMQNTTLALRLVKKMKHREAEDRAGAELTRVGLFDKRQSYPRQLSGGQQQRVAIARGLAMNPRLMLFDEVTSALDPQLTSEVLRVIELLAADGVTMILVTHEMEFARRLATNIVFMKDGKIHESGKSDILDSPNTQELRDFVNAI